MRKQDVRIAKNYLTEPELGALNNLVEQYLVFAEGQAMRRIPMRMSDWIGKLNGFLALNEREILDNAGRISHELAMEHAESEYDAFSRLRARETDHLSSDFDEVVKQIAPPRRREKGRGN